MRDDAEEPDCDDSASCIVEHAIVSDRVFRFHHAL